MSGRNSVKNADKKTEKTYKIPVYLSNIGGRIIVDRYIEVTDRHNIYEAKQSIWDWWKQYSKEKQQNFCFGLLNCNEGWIDLQYEDGFKWRLFWDQFPNRNLIPCYEKARGQYVIHHYEEGIDPLPSISQNGNPALITCSNIVEGIKV